MKLLFHPRLATFLDVAVDPPPADGGGGLSIPILILAGVVIAVFIIAAVWLILRARNAKSKSEAVKK